MGLLRSRSRSQRRLKMSVNVCPDDIFWTTEHFGMAMQHHEPECHADFCVCAIFKVKVTARAHMIIIWFFLLYFLNCWTLGNQTWSDDTLSVAKVSSEKNGLLHSRSRSQWRVKMLMFVQMISSKPPNILFPNLVLWYIIMSRSVVQKELFAIFISPDIIPSGWLGSKH